MTSREENGRFAHIWKGRSPLFLHIIGLFLSISTGILYLLTWICFKRWRNFFLNDDRTPVFFTPSKAWVPRFMVCSGGMLFFICNGLHKFAMNQYSSRRMMGTLLERSPSVDIDMVRVGEMLSTIVDQDVELLEGKSSKPRQCKCCIPLMNERLKCWTLLGCQCKCCIPLMNEGLKCWTLLGCLYLEKPSPSNLP